MIPAIILAVASLIVGVIFGRQERSVGAFFFATFMSALASLIVIMFIMLIGVTTVGEDYKLIDDQNLKAISVSSNINGSFFLGSGSVDEESVYYYYAAQDGGFVLQNVPTDDALVIEDSSNPRIESYTSVSKNSLWYFGQGDRSYKIYIPAGSITNQFNMNLPS